MKNTKYINILVDPATHAEYKGLLRRRGKGERVQYVLGNNAMAFMMRALKNESQAGKSNG